MLPKEKACVLLMFTGIVLTLCGIAAAMPGKKKLDLDPPASLGAWKSGGISSEAAQNAAPWIISVGIAALVVSLVLRRR